MNKIEELRQVQCVLERGKTIFGAEIAAGHKVYESEYSIFCKALATIDRLIEKPAPQGWKLVPIEPTEEMSLTFRREWQDMDIRGKLRSEMFKAAYKALLSAAPTPAPTEKVDVESLKLEVEKCFPSMNYTESSLVDVVIDHLANTGRLR